MVRATGEQSPSHARNAGAERARRDWILFLDADCRAPADLLDRFFAQPIADDVGAVAGAVVPAAGSGSGPHGLAVRYGAAKSFLDQDAHLAHPFMPRAVAANLLVRREAFEAVGGFYEGVRAAEDTDFSWRLQRAGWRLEGRPAAPGRAPLPDHACAPCAGSGAAMPPGGPGWAAATTASRPEPALARAAGAVLHRRSARPAAPARADAAGPGRRRPPCGPPRSRPLPGAGRRAGRRGAGRVRPVQPAAPRRRRAPARVVLVADRFPAPRRPAGRLRAHPGRRARRGRGAARGARPAGRAGADHRLPRGRRRRRPGVWRWRGLLVRHPLRCARDPGRRAAPGRPPSPRWPPRWSAWLRDGDARVHPLGGEDARAVAVAAGAAGRPSAGDVMRVHLVDPPGVHAALRPRAGARRWPAPGAEVRADHQPLCLRRRARPRRLRAARAVLPARAWARAGSRLRRLTKLAAPRPRHAALPPASRPRPTSCTSSG